jgi:hypothetical protein
MPAAEMISGTIIGEIRIAMIADLNGTCDWDRPMAASVPKPVARMVATGAIITELVSACCQSGLVKKSW